MADTKTDADNGYREYVERKHSGFNTSREMIADVVGRVTNSKILDDQRIVEGEVNEVHRVTTSSGQSVIVRISRSDRPRFEAERWAINKAREAGVPAPDILVVERRTVDGSPLTLCVERQIEGIPLRDFIKLVGADSLEARNVVESAGETLAKIHSVTVGGFGELNPDGTGHNSSWEEYMTKWSRKRDELTEPSQGIGLNLEIVSKAIKILDKHTDLYALESPQLLHGDYGGDHIFVNNGVVCGVIDFENCKGGDPVWDFSWWSYFANNRPPIKWLKTGYIRGLRLTETFDVRVRLGKLRLGLDMVRYYYNEQNTHGQNLARERLIEIVGEF